MSHGLQRTDGDVDVLLITHAPYGFSSTDDATAENKTFVPKLFSIASHSLFHSIRTNYLNFLLIWRKAAKEITAVVPILPDISLEKRKTERQTLQVDACFLYAKKALGYKQTSNVL